MSRLLRRAAVAITATGLVVGAVTAYLVRDPAPVGYWRSAQAYEQYAQDYRRAFAELPAPRETRDLRIGFGVVRAYRFGDPQPGRAPILLLPGRGSGVPMWAENLSRMLADGGAVYAVDALGDAGMSIQDKPIRGEDDVAAWVDEVRAALGLGRVHLVGHSFGAWSAANYAARHPDRVVSLTLWEPILVFAGLRWQMYVAVLPSALPFLPESLRRKGLSWIGGDDSGDPRASAVGAMVDSGTSGYVAKLPTPAVLDGAARARLTMPVFVGLGERSAMTDTAAAASAARRLPNATVRVWPDGTHSLPMQYPDELQAELAALRLRAGG
ncbi:alpha/beta fold hydrolase [Tsukamurella sp. PLM1]|uniref:alpha/beta fold hydrolase n=1 Tax=Tsukamurella sp. PLM1 TaxID=2929795 RepID=UPI00206191C6|nr:alpha/beta hydrolase [Tsukamurella sp. PLM1]BDH56429.1 hypothetical protein MTP03_13680 [Tsukamurella sp. PLM1]